MRLTLRTLLAYLDDTIEPLEIKTIGQKVAESETAQELIARIKQATRRRRITTPPATGPNSFEPNMVAAYLDNELAAEQVAELEKIALESDVHLAEVASCHQILTLVLGEPPSVPPPAKQRMYALVHGREAIPFRKPAAAGAASASANADHDGDETFLLGLPFYRRANWLRWALPIAAVLLFTIVGVALWRSISDLQPSPTRTGQVADNNKNNKPEPNGKDKPADQPNGKPNNAGQPAPAEGATGSGKTLQNDGSNPPSSKDPTKDSGAGPSPTTETANPNKKFAPPDVREQEPSKQRVKLGMSRTDPNRLGLLVSRKSADDDWQYLVGSKLIYSNDELVSLPGYASEVRLDCGLHLLLRGHLREFTPPKMDKMDYLQESAVRLHKPKDVDVDLTLQRGRLFLSNHSEPAKPLVVRLRFYKKKPPTANADVAKGMEKAWDLELQPGAEAVVDLINDRPQGQPRTELRLVLLTGKAGLAVEDDYIPTVTVPGECYFVWSSQMKKPRYGRLRLSQKDLEGAARVIFAQTPTANTDVAKGMEKALESLHRQMKSDTSPVVVLQGMLSKSEKPFEHFLAIYGLGALDEIKSLMDVLGAADLIHPPDRSVARFALRRWLDRDSEQPRKLYDPDTKRGLLISQLHYTTTDAGRIAELLDDTKQDLFSEKSFEDLAHDLVSDNVVIAELARWRLQQMSTIAGVRLSKLEKFNAALPSDRRKAAEREVLEKLDEKLLPMSTSGKPSSAPGPRSNPPKGPGSKSDNRPPR